MAVGILKIGEIKTPLTTIVKSGDTVNSYYTFSGSVNTTLYNDITSNDNWMGVGRSEYDYMFCRNQVMVRTAVIGFSALTTTEKEVASACFSISKADRDSVHTESEQELNWTYFVDIMSLTRAKRWVAAKDWISFRLSVADSVDLAKSTNTLSHEFREYGIESFALDGVDGLFDWLEGTSSFSGGTGFPGKSYWTQDYQDGIMGILRDGIY